MHNRKLFTLLASTAAIAAAPLAWAQSTDATVGTGTSTSTTTQDRAMDTTGTSSTMGDSDQSTSGTSTTTGTTSGTSSATTPGYSSGTSTGSAATTGGTGKLQGTDATFLQKAMEGGREEVQNAQVAMRSAQRAEVRNAASMMLEDHQSSNQKLEQLASSKGWSMPAASTSDTAESDQSRLGSGAAFDDNYLEQEIRHHRETISLYRAQASSGSDPELRQFAKDSLPKLEHHLEMLQGSLSAK